MTSRPERAAPGVLSTTGSQMKYAHGQHAAYVLDLCRCSDCSAANSAYERGRAARIEPAFVSAVPARDHVRFLMESGVGLKQIVKVSGVAHGTLWKLVYGVNGRPSRRCRKSTLDALLVVTPLAAADGAKVDAGPTWELLDAMFAAGVPKSTVATHLGVGKSIQFSRRQIAARNARAVKDLYDRWVAGEVVLERRDSWGNTRTITPPAPPPRPQDDWEARWGIFTELAEIIEARNVQRWRARAACWKRPPYLWFPARGDTETMRAALKVCRSCPVRTECADAHAGEIDGLWGGLTPGQRRARRRIEVTAA